MKIRRTTPLEGVYMHGKRKRRWVEHPITKENNTIRGSLHACKEKEEVGIRRTTLLEGV